MKSKKILFSFIVISLMVLIACEAPSNPVATDSGSLEKRAAYPAYAGDGVEGNYVLWANMDIEAGLVTITEDGVTIQTNGLADIRGVHIYLWSEEDNVPTFRPVPAQADYRLENVHDSEVSFTLSGEEFSYITVHVALENGIQAYIGGDEYPFGYPGDFRKAAKQWWGYVGYSAEEECEKWCDCHVC